MEEILKQIEVGLNPQESFTKMNKDRNVKNGILSQVMHLNPPMVKEAPEDIRNQKTSITPFNRDFIRQHCRITPF